MCFCFSQGDWSVAPELGSVDSVGMSEINMNLCHQKNGNLDCFCTPS